MSQREMVVLDSLLPSTYPYRQFHAYVPFATETLTDVVHVKSPDGYGVDDPFAVCCCNS
jgi:hypothetical protein